MAMFGRFGTGWLRDCILCGLMSGGGDVCERCLALLPQNAPCCERCGRRLHARQPAGVECAGCQANPPAFDRARAPLCYEFPVDAVLKKLKFRGRLEYAPALAGLLLPLLEEAFPDCDVLVPVPLHRWRHAVRGFNQADELCRPLSRRAGVPMTLEVARRRATRPQTGLSARQRRENLRDAFRVREGFCYRRPVIVDDVLTTGSTAGALAGALKAAGAEKVGVLAVARSTPA